MPGRRDAAVLNRRQPNELRSPTITNATIRFTIEVHFIAIDDNGGALRTMVSRGMAARTNPAVGRCDGTNPITNASLVLELIGDTAEMAPAAMKRSHRSTSGSSKRHTDGALTYASLAQQFFRLERFVTGARLEQPIPPGAWAGRAHRARRQVGLMVGRALCGACVVRNVAFGANSLR